MIAADGHSDPFSTLICCFSLYHCHSLHWFPSFHINVSLGTRRNLHIAHRFVVIFMKTPYQRATNRIMRLIFDIYHQISIALEERYTELVQIVLQFFFPLLNICLCQLLYVCNVFIWLLFRCRQISPVKPHFFLSPARLLNQMQFVFAFNEGSECRQRITCPILRSYIAQTNSDKWETQLFCQIHIRCWKICSIELISLPPLYLAIASPSIVYNGESKCHHMKMKERPFLWATIRKLSIPLD